jgi:Zn-dependent peptidase ImmA (M78 family)
MLREPMPFDIERFFECDLESLTGVRTDYRELAAGIHGYTDVDEMESVIALHLMESDSHKRFRRSTIAHETGHVIQHALEFRQRKEALRFVHDTDQVSLRMYRERDVPLYRNPEWQAWRFAKGLLMPAPSVRLAMRRGCDWEDLSDIFDVNPAFVFSRMKELGRSIRSFTLESKAIMQEAIDMVAAPRREPF